MCTKKAPCKTTHSSFTPFYSEIISACPRAWWLLKDLNAVKKYSSGKHFGIPEKRVRRGTLNLAGLPEWSVLLHLLLAWGLVLSIKCDHYVSSWRPDPISIKSMEIFLSASMNIVSVPGDVPILNSGFGSVLSMHWKGLYFSNPLSGLICCFNMQFINILTVIQVLFANKKKKKPWALTRVLIL